MQDITYPRHMTFAALPILTAVFESSLALSTEKIACVMSAFISVSYCAGEV